MWRDLGTGLAAAAGVAAALGTLGTAAWWLLAPRVREFVRQAAAAADDVAHVGSQLRNNGGASVKDKVDLLPAVVEVLGDLKEAQRRTNARLDLHMLEAEPLADFVRRQMTAQTTIRVESPDGSPVVATVERTHTE